MQPPDIIDLPAFEQIKNSMGADFIGKIVETYCVETPLLLARLPQALLDSDYASFRMAVHSIKSASSSLGALQFAGIARELEILAREENLASAAPARVQALLAAYPSVAQALRALCHA